MPRTFTLDEANGLLPRLREILLEMQEKNARLDALREPLSTARRASAGNGHMQEQAAIAEAERLAGRLTELMRQIEAMGCELKGLEQGLIDFPCQHEGRIVYLCWQLGEERIAHWHETDAGFAGRQAL